MGDVPFTMVACAGEAAGAAVHAGWGNGWFALATSFVSLAGSDGGWRRAYLPYDFYSMLWGMQTSLILWGAWGARAPRFRRGSGVTCRRIMWAAPLTPAPHKK